MDVIVVDNALLSAAVGKLRDSRTDAEGFRSALSYISTIVLLEAGRREPVIGIHSARGLAWADALLSAC